MDIYIISYDGKGVHSYIKHPQRDSHSTQLKRELFAWPEIIFKCPCVPVLVLSFLFSFPFQLSVSAFRFLPFHLPLTRRSHTSFHRLGTIPVEWAWPVLIDWIRILAPCILGHDSLVPSLSCAVWERDYGHKCLEIELQTASPTFRYTMHYVLLLFPLFEWCREVFWWHTDKLNRLLNPASRMRARGNNARKFYTTKISQTTVFCEV